MKITVHRFLSNNDETLSYLLVDGRPMGFGLEDEYRAEKVVYETRIPAGAYKVGIREAGSIAPRYKAKFPAFHEGMLWVQDVPGFEWIYFHMGNTDGHTSGCLLVAEQARINAQGRFTTPNSEPAYVRFYQAVYSAARHGGLVCEIIDGDR